jgi:hypothetical protein
MAFSLVNDVSYTAELGTGLASLELESSGDVTSETDETTNFLPSSCKAAIEKNLLMQIGYFAARATHVPHRKLGKLARRVIIKISKVLRDDPSSLEVVHDMVARCHRSQAEGLLDRVLKARESTYDSLPPAPRSKQQRLYTDNQRKGEESTPRKSPDQLSSHMQEQRRSVSPSSHGRISPRRSPASHGKTSPHLTARAPVASSSLKNSAEKVGVQDSIRAKVQSSGGREGKVQGNSVEAASLVRSSSRDERHRLGRQRSRPAQDGNMESEEFIPSDESFQSALSELDVLDCSADTVMATEDEREEFVGGVGEESSTSNSHDSRKSLDARRHNTSSGSSIEKGVEPVVSGFPNKPGYMR